MCLVGVCAATQTAPHANGDAGHVSYPLGHLVALTLILMTRDARSVNGPLKISTRNKSRARAENFREMPVYPVLHELIPRVILFSDEYENLKRSM